MKKAVIWDLDGTLFDSYGVIIESVLQTFSENNIPASREQVYNHAISFSLKSLFSMVSQETGVSAELLQQQYNRISRDNYLLIKPMLHGLEALDALQERGVENYVFTHRGTTTIPVLRHLGMDGYFIEILTSQSGFTRKPDPEGLLYLIDKYDLDLQNTFYVGDRTLDMLCAFNAGIPGILFQPEGSVDVSGGTETYIISDLLEVINII